MNNFEMSPIEVFVRVFLGTLFAYMVAKAFVLATVENTVNTYRTLVTEQGVDAADRWVYMVHPEIELMEID